MRRFFQANKTQKTQRLILKYAGSLSDMYSAIFQFHELCEMEYLCFVIPESYDTFVFLYCMLFSYFPQNIVISFFKSRCSVFTN